MLQNLKKINSCSYECKFILSTSAAGFANLLGKHELNLRIKSFILQSEWQCPSPENLSLSGDAETIRKLNWADTSDPA